MMQTHDSAPARVARTLAQPRTSPDVPRRVGLANDYVRIPYANGSSFASQFLYRELTRRGHEVTVIGPREPNVRAQDLPPSHVCLASLPMRNHPGLHIPFPDAAGLAAVEALNLDALIAQTGSGFMAIAPWLRLKRRVPALCVNTVHLPSVYDAVLPARLSANTTVQAFCQGALVPWLMSNVVRVYNEIDGLVVLSHGLKNFWREQGVRVPIHVIPRPVDASIFAGPAGEDPFPLAARRGSRLLVVCRHTREKEVARLLEIFAAHVATICAEATLTLVGDGPDHDEFKALAHSLGVAERVFFMGEYPVTMVKRFYRHADLFVYTSLSETYGQVVSEALWCGLPAVAFHDGRGVSDQIRHGQDGLLIAPGPDRALANAAFGAALTALLQQSERRQAMAEAAARNARERCDAENSVDAWQRALASAREHCERELTEARPLSSLVPLMQWQTTHAIMVATGFLRAPATLNRHKRGQPGWQTPGLSASPG